MRRVLTTAVLFAMIGTGTALADDDCNVPMSDWQPREALQQKLESEGWKVHRIKTDDGCYKVHATDGKGQRIEAAFNPKTFETVKFEHED